VRARGRARARTRELVGDGVLMAQSGVLEVEALEPDRVRASYSITFAEGTIEGRVLATECALSTSTDSPRCAPAD